PIVSLGASVLESLGAAKVVSGVGAVLSYGAASAFTAGATLELSEAGAALPAVAAAALSVVAPVLSFLTAEVSASGTLMMCICAAASGTIRAEPPANQKAAARPRTMARPLADRRDREPGAGFAERSGPGVEGARPTVFNSTSPLLALGNELCG